MKSIIEINSETISFRIKNFSISTFILFSYSLIINNFVNITTVINEINQNFTYYQENILKKKIKVSKCPARNLIITFGLFNEQQPIKYRKSV